MKKDYVNVSNDPKVDIMKIKTCICISELLYQTNVSNIYIHIHVKGVLTSYHNHISHEICAVINGKRIQVHTHIMTMIMILCYHIMALP